MLRGQTVVQTGTSAVKTNPVFTNPRPQRSLASRNNKNPSNNFSGPPTAAILGGQDRGQRMR
jgi:hypothetical protein